MPGRDLRRAVDGATPASSWALLGAGFLVPTAGASLGRSLVKLVPVWGQTAGIAWGAAGRRRDHVRAGQGGVPLPGAQARGNDGLGGAAARGLPGGLREGREMREQRDACKGSRVKWVLERFGRLRLVAAGFALLPADRPAGAGRDLAARSPRPACGGWRPGWSRWHSRRSLHWLAGRREAAALAELAEVRRRAATGRSRRRSAG
jgi:hypothetical protein